MTITTVKLSTLRELVDAGSVRSVSLLGQKGGYAVSVHLGMTERILAGKDGDPRVFATLDTAARTLRELGVAAFEVNVVNFEPGRLRAARPELAATMRRKHAAGEHDAWFRAEVAKTLAKVEDGTANFTDHDTVFAELRAYASGGAGKVATKAPTSKSSHPAAKAAK